MVTNITSLTGNGLKDWLIQRVTSAYFAVFVVVLFAFLLIHPHCDFITWTHVFHQRWVQVGFVTAIGAYVLHASFSGAVNCVIRISD
jgi:succinate dehydrogenase / fumarate reductase membrane anchor subunit